MATQPDHTAQPPERIAELKERERKRKELDPSYITAEEVRSLPPDMLDDPAVQQRIRWSEPRWPERVAPLSALSKGAPGGQGEETQRRDVASADLFEPPRGDSRYNG